MVNIDVCGKYRCIYVYKYRCKNDLIVEVKMDFKAGDQSLLIKKGKALIMFELSGPAVITG